MEAKRAVHRPEPWNKGKLVGPKAPFKLKEIWAIRVRLQMQQQLRELALQSPASTASCAFVTWSACACATLAMAITLPLGRLLCSTRLNARCSSRSRQQRARPSTLGSGTPDFERRTIFSQAAYIDGRIWALVSTRESSTAGLRRSALIRRRTARTRCVAPSRR
jgi:hypothetical protein